MSDPASDWSTYIITTLITAVGSMVGAIIFLAKIIETKFVTEIRDLKKCLTDLEVKYDKKLKAQEEAFAEQKLETENCLKDRQELAVKVARLESTSDNLQRLARSSEMKSMNRSDLIREQIKELEEKVKDKS